jgi:cytochrome oxidase Cu insertion factor (SCO1/SenC/PrrC family)
MTGAGRFFGWTITPVSGRRATLSAGLKWLLLIAVPITVFVAGAATLLERATESGTGLRGPDAGPFRGSETPGSIRLPAFTLREWNGKPVASRDLHGKVVLVTFLETKCREACPVIADRIDMAVGRLSAAERGGVYALAISTHPRDDTPSNVREFLRVHRVLGELHYLIGTEGELRRVWRSFYILAALDSGDADTHSSPVRIFNPKGKWVSTLHPGVDLTAANLAHDLRLALRDS